MADSSSSFARRLLHKHHDLVARLSPRPLPLSYWRLVAGILKLAGLRSGTLGLPADEEALDALKNETLRGVFPAGHRFSGWAIDVATVEIIWALLLRHRPLRILECGAGTSTFVFAKYAADHAPDCRILTLEQDAAVKTDFDAKLAARSLAQYVRIIHAPLDGVGGYSFDPSELAAHFSAKPADFVFIDGPSGPNGCREHVLPAVAGVCAPGAVWLLDDALRDGEMHALTRWKKTAGLQVGGIIPTRKGLARGCVAAPSHFGRTN